MKTTLSRFSVTPESTFQTGAMIALSVAALMMTIGALNGGTALTASVWDSLATWLKNMLSSTWVLVLAFIVLVAAVWQMAHGGGYGMLALVLGVLAVALIGPGFITSMSTSIGDVGSIASPPVFAIPFAK
jgi:uncharacterized membrane protein